MAAPDAVGRVRRFTRGAQKTGGKPSAVDVPLAAVEAVFNGRFCLTRKLLPSVFTRHQLNPRVREDERYVGARLARLVCEAPRTSTTQGDNSGALLVEAGYYYVCSVSENAGHVNCHRAPMTRGPAPSLPSSHARRSFW